MKKVIVLFVTFMAVVTNLQAQKFTIGAGVNVGLPVGDAADFSSVNVGGELQGECKFNETVSGVFTTGYTHFIGKDFEGIKFNYGIIPLLAGARFYPSARFFIGGQLGYAFFTGDAEGDGFAYRPQVGYNAGVAEIALSYNGISNNGTISWIGLSGILKFGKRK